MVVLLSRATLGKSYQGRRMACKLDLVMHTQILFNLIFCKDRCFQEYLEVLGKWGRMLELRKLDFGFQKIDIFYKFQQSLKLSISLKDINLHHIQRVKLVNKFLLLIIIRLYMEPTVSIDDNIIYYFTNFHLFSEEESKLLCNYKFFIENMIMKLGEDWRIQSNLLAQEIVTIRTEEHPEKDLTDFSLFNQFLSGYLKGKIGKEYEFTNFCETQIQKEFLQTVNDQFPE